MFFDGFFFFFLRNSVNSLISICLSDLKDQKLPVPAKKTQIDDYRPKFLLARWAHKWSRQSGRLLMSKPDSCKIISKSDQRFLSTRFFIEQKAPIHQSHIYRQITILRSIFEKGHPRNIPVKSFQNLTSCFREKSLRISSCP